MNQVAIKEEQNFDVVLKEIDAVHKMCQSLMKTKHYQAMGEAGIFAIIQKAKSLHIPPLEALNGGLYYVQGKVGMSSEMMASLIRQNGHSVIKDVKSDNSICILHGRRADNKDTWTVSFSMEDAKKAGLAKGMYDKYPAIMLYNRAMSMLARQLFPDVIKGAGYTHEELLEIKQNSTNNISSSDFDNRRTFSEDTEISIIEKDVISKEQADELNELLSQCDPEYQQSVYKFLKISSSSDGLSNLPIHLYDRVKAAALKKREEAKLKSQEAEVAIGEQ